MLDSDYQQMLDMVHAMHFKLKLYRTKNAELNKPSNKEAKEVILGSLKRDIKVLSKNIKELESEIE